MVIIWFRGKRRKEGEKEDKETIKTIESFHSTSYSTSIKLSFEVQSYYGMSLACLTFTAEETGQWEKSRKAYSWETKGRNGKCPLKVCMTTMKTTFIQGSSLDHGHGGHSIHRNE